MVSFNAVNRTENKSRLKRLIIAFCSKPEIVILSVSGYWQWREWQDWRMNREVAESGAGDSERKVAGVI